MTTAAARTGSSIVVAAARGPPPGGVAHGGWGGSPGDEAASMPERGRTGGQPTQTRWDRAWSISERLGIQTSPGPGSVGGNVNTLSEDRKPTPPPLPCCPQRLLAYPSEGRRRRGAGGDRAFHAVALAQAHTMGPSGASRTGVHCHNNRCSVAEPGGGPSGGRGGKGVHRRCGRAGWGSGKWRARTAPPRTPPTTCPPRGQAPPPPGRGTVANKVVG